MSENIVDLTSGLYRFVMASESSLGSAQRLSAETSDRLLRHARALLCGFTAARARTGERLGTTIDQISGRLRAMMADLCSKPPLAQDLRDHWQALGEHYEALVLHIQSLRLPVPEGIELEHIKPRNNARILFHAAMGVVAIALYEFVLSRTLTLAIGGGLLALFIGLEVLRRHSHRWNERLYGRLFARISRPREAHSVCTSTWYLGGLMVGVVLLPKHAIELGALCLAFGDPAASLAGKRWGKKKIVADKSLAGTLDFFVVSAVLGAAFIAWRIPELGLARALLVAAAVGASGAAVELFSNRINDNFSIPVAAGAIAALLL